MDEGHGSLSPDVRAKDPADGVKRRRLTLLRNAALALTSLAVGLAACEFALRLYYPRYEFAANPPPSAADREARPTSSSSFTRAHNPDTGTQHRMIYNELGARTSRRFAAESLAETVNIAFFGDSGVENIHMPVQYAFTEHLDYLLNHLPAGWQPTQDPSPPAGPAGKRFNVLNFGVFGSGPAKAYSRWRSVSGHGKFHHVFFVFSRNDIDDLGWEIRGEVISIDESGNVQVGDSASPPTWKRLIARLHFTYLAIDAWKRLAGQAADEQERADQADERFGDYRERWFQKLILQWKREVEASGGRFHVMLGQTRHHPRLFAKIGLSVTRDELDLVDLFHCFSTNIPDYRPRDWRFVNDPHANPAANMVEASCLYRYLEEGLDLPRRADAALAAARYNYYQAFLDSPRWEGDRFAPAPPWVPPAPRTPPARQAGSEAIVNHYLDLELHHQPTERDRNVVASARAAGVLAAADWNVFASLPERLLVYTQAPCEKTRDEAANPIFLHVYPYSLEKLSDRRRRYGFENLDHGPWMHIVQDPDECVSMVRLPEWPVARVGTGQFTRQEDAEGNTVYQRHWEADFALPLARSVWDVYAAKGGRRALDYVKRPCPQTARQARFFLHVYPLRASDSPSSFRPYLNLDFHWSAGPGVDGRSYDATADTCRISAALPDFPIATIHTGQFRDGLIDERLWDVHIRLAEVERLALPQGEDRRE